MKMKFYCTDRTCGGEDCKTCFPGNRDIPEDEETEAMSDTPRTDKEAELGVGPRAIANGNAVIASFARQLETELTAALAALAANEALVKEMKTAYGKGVSLGKQEALNYTAEERERYALHVAQANEYSQLRSQLEASQAECAQLNRELGKRFDLEKVIDERDDDLNGLKLDLETAQAECERLEKLINSPELIDFQKAVVLEAAHQRERWGSDHDAGKTPADWFWLVGYVAGKALSKPEKRLHHIITTAAVCANWHAAELGLTDMRLGIAVGKTAAMQPVSGEEKL